MKGGHFLVNQQLLCSQEGFRLISKSFVLQQQIFQRCEMRISGGTAATGVIFGTGGAPWCSGFYEKPHVCDGAVPQSRLLNLLQCSGCNRRPATKKARFNKIPEKSPAKKG